MSTLELPSNMWITAPRDLDPQVKIYTYERRQACESFCMICVFEDSSDWGIRMEQRQRFSKSRLFPTLVGDNELQDFVAWAESRHPCAQTPALGFPSCRICRHACDTLAQPAEESGDFSKPNSTKCALKSGCLLQVVRKPHHKDRKSIRNPRKKATTKFQDIIYIYIIYLYNYIYIYIDFLDRAELYSLLQCFSRGEAGFASFSKSPCRIYSTSLFGLCIEPFGNWLWPWWSKFS